MSEAPGTAPIHSELIPAEPPLWPPVLGIIWLTIPALVAAYLRSSDLGTLLQYLWAWSIIVPALGLGIGALVYRFRLRHSGPAGLRRKLWYWTGAIYALAAIPILVILL